MRVSPVGWLFDKEQTVLNEARKSASCAHNHPEGIKGAQATAIALYFARKGKEKLFIRQYITAKFGYDLHKTVDEIRKTYLYNESCQGTVPEALICFFESNSFEDAIRKAISIGGDSDTIGAITGGIAEAFYDIPVELANKARSYLPNDMLEILKLSGEKTHPLAIDLDADTKRLRERFRKLKK
jgi:ADP-ribosylglycohydrolase